MSVSDVLFSPILSLLFLQRRVVFGQIVASFLAVLSICVFTLISFTPPTLSEWANTTVSNTSVALAQSWLNENGTAVDVGVTVGAYAGGLALWLVASARGVMSKTMIRRNLRGRMSGAERERKLFTHLFMKKNPYDLARLRKLFGNALFDSEPISLGMHATLELHTLGGGVAITPVALLLSYFTYEQDTLSATATFLSTSYLASGLMGAVAFLVLIQPLCKARLALRGRSYSYTASRSAALFVSVVLAEFLVGETVGSVQALGLALAVAAMVWNDQSIQDSSNRKKARALLWRYDDMKEEKQRKRGKKAVVMSELGTKMMNLHNNVGHSAFLRLLLVWRETGDSKLIEHYLSRSLTHVEAKRLMGDLFRPDLAEFDLSEWKGDERKWDKWGEEEEEKEEKNEKEEERRGEKAKNVMDSSHLTRGPTPVMASRGVEEEEGNGREGEGESNEEEENSARSLERGMEEKLERDMLAQLEEGVNDGRREVGKNRAQEDSEEEEEEDAIFDDSEEDEEGDEKGLETPAVRRESNLTAATSAAAARLPPSSLRADAERRRKLSMQQREAKRDRLPPIGRGARSRTPAMDHTERNLPPTGGGVTTRPFSASTHRRPTSALRGLKSSSLAQLRRASGVKEGDEPSHQKSWRRRLE
eukprot:CAMPEP_0113896606 /NCGR_PEP_ID=MMETSP0780_2-20120614/18138_1 /TAXON_ID=652834 /ORGANISM="Palpitomonas bilix" /LENGTH=646 /DNA_ID=CAMNT_0000887819 /DNA_START=463 /DNA_END=2404 /DNA_ORIENTATION=+ /assembly_acc=CAM_ASM_000599